MNNSSVCLFTRSLARLASNETSTLSSSTESFVTRLSIQALKATPVNRAVLADLSTRFYVRTVLPFCAASVSCRCSSFTRSLYPFPFCLCSVCFAPTQTLVPHDFGEAAPPVRYSASAHSRKPSAGKNGNPRPTVLRSF
jgi:hypothetical protein